MLSSVESAGIEPALRACHARVIPFHYDPDSWSARESDPDFGDANAASCPLDERPVRGGSVANRTLWPDLETGCSP